MHQKHIDVNQNNLTIYTTVKIAAELYILRAFSFNNNKKNHSI